MGSGTGEQLLLLSQLLLMLLPSTIQDIGIVAHAVGSAITDHVSGVGSRGNWSGSGGNRQEGRRRTRPRSNVMMVVVMVMMVMVQQMMMIAQDITDQ